MLFRSQLTTVQVQALSTAAIAVLSTSQFVSFTTACISSLTTSQIQVLHSDSIAALHSATLTTAFTATQVQAMNTAQVITYLTSPLVLDLTGSGINTVGLNPGVQFDLAGTGSAQNVGWIGAGSGFLVRDLNHDGLINNGTEMFGNATTLASGGKAQDGFQALAQLDSNHDGVLNALDTAFSDLGVWVDSNSDGITQPGEIHSLASLNITQFNLNAASTAVNNNGNWILQDSTYVTSNGTTHQLSDVWFQNGPAASSSASSSTAQSNSFATTQVASLSIEPIPTPNLAQFNSLSNEGANSLSTAQITSLSYEQVQPLTVVGSTSLTPGQAPPLSPADILPQVQLPVPGSVAALTGLTSLQDLPAVAPQLPGNQFQGLTSQGQVTQNIPVTGPFPPHKPDLPKG